MFVYLTANLACDFDLARLAELACCHKSILYRWFRQHYQTTPIRWLWTIRILVAARVLEKSHGYSLTDVAFACGFKSSSHFTRLFRALTSVSPSEYKKVTSLNFSEDRWTHSFDLVLEIRQHVARAIRDFPPKLTLFPPNSLD
jgi:transcriptional regulator GlxA family with amidase domain